MEFNVVLKAPDCCVKAMFRRPLGFLGGIWPCQTKRWASVLQCSPMGSVFLGLFLGVNLTLPHPVVMVGCVPMGSANRPRLVRIPRDHVGMSHPGAESTASGGQ